MEDITGTGGNSGAISSDATGGASPASQTPSTAVDASSAAQSTQQTGTTDSTTAERSPFIPRERFDEVNTKLKQLEQWREQHGWAESVPREQLEQMASWYARYQGDPGDFLEQAYQEALSHPVHGATVKSRIGRMLASLRAQQAQAEPEPVIPDIPIVNERNEPVGNLAEIVQRILAKEISPLKQDYETRQTEAQQAKAREQQQAQAYAQADADVAYVTKRPFFKDHKDEILKVFKENPSMSIREAADYVLDTKVLPGYGQKAQAQVLSDLQQKAHAQTVNPSTPTGSAKPKFKNELEALRYYDAHPEEAAAMAER